jgi:hypothetical protein
MRSQVKSQESRQEQEGWSGDILKDTFTYRYIDISMTLLDLVMENQQVEDHYQAWIKTREDADAEAEITPLALSELRNDSGSQILVLGLPICGQFMVVFRTSAFTAKIILAQDQDTTALQAASVAEFSGDLHYAIHWGQDFLARIDEEMINAGM